jgi:hypothetical protein
LRRVATRDEPPNERRIRAGQRAPDGAGLSSSAVAIGSLLFSDPGFSPIRDHFSLIASKLISIW